jgi:gamma-glutamyltranspeptidase/glutathione hydrolase
VMHISVAAFGTVGENVPLPGRRMTSSMAPTIVSYQGQLALVIGTPGGDTIPSTLVLVLRRLLDAGQTLDVAVNAPRLHHGFVPDTLRWESTYPVPPATQAELRKLGHHFDKPSLALGDVNLILALGPELYGYADPREGGVARAADP